MVLQQPVATLRYLFTNTLKISTRIMGMASYVVFMEI